MTDSDTTNEVFEGVSGGSGELDVAPARSIGGAIDQGYTLVLQPY